jgi:WXG100 family type VII secretion target
MKQSHLCAGPNYANLEIGALCPVLFSVSLGVFVASYKVSSDVLASTSAQLAAGSSDVNAELSRLRKLVESLGSEWEGSGAGAFNDLYTEFNTAGAQLTEALDGISSLLNKAAGYYAESETNVANAFRS